MITTSPNIITFGRRIIFIRLLSYLKRRTYLITSPKLDLGDVLYLRTSPKLHLGDVVYLRTSPKMF